MNGTAPLLARTNGHLIVLAKGKIQKMPTTPPSELISIFRILIVLVPITAIGIFGSHLLFTGTIVLEPDEFIEESLKIFVVALLSGVPAFLSERRNLREQQRLWREQRDLLNLSDILLKRSAAGFIEASKAMQLELRSPCQTNQKTPCRPSQWHQLAIENARRSGLWKKLASETTYVACLIDDLNISPVTFSAVKTRMAAINQTIQERMQEGHQDSPDPLPDLLDETMSILEEL